MTVRVFTCLNASISVFNACVHVRSCLIRVSVSLAQLVFLIFIFTNVFAHVALLSNMLE